MFAFIEFTVKEKTLMEVHMNVSNVLSVGVSSYSRPDLNPMAAREQSENSL